MKSQDIFLLLKLISLQLDELKLKSERQDFDENFNNWKDWEVNEDEVQEESQIEEIFQAHYSMRTLSESTGISKSEISLALQRCYYSSLAKFDSIHGIPRANIRGLMEFIMYGIKYVFPVKIGPITRGIATTLGAPVLKGKIFTAGNLIPVWPDAHGKTKGQELEPLYKTVPKAVKRDANLYALLALVDTIRIGSSRERNIGVEELKKILKELE